MNIQSRQQNASIMDSIDNSYDFHSRQTSRKYDKDHLYNWQAVGLQFAYGTWLHSGALTTRPHQVVHNDKQKLSPKFWSQKIRKNRNGQKSRNPKVYMFSSRLKRTRRRNRKFSALTTGPPRLPDRFRRGLGYLNGTEGFSFPAVGDLGVTPRIDFEN